MIIPCAALDIVTSLTCSLDEFSDDILMFTFFSEIYLKFVNYGKYKKNLYIINAINFKLNLN